MSYKEATHESAHKPVWIFAYFPSSLQLGAGWGWGEESSLQAAKAGKPYFKVIF